MPDRKRSQATPALEWTVGALGAVLFIGMLAIVIWNGAVRTQAPPSIVARVERIEPVASGYVVAFKASNDGDQTAAEVRLVATLHLPSGASEEREATLDFLPPHSSREGGFLFTADPRGRRLEIEAQGYARP